MEGSGEFMQMNVTPSGAGMQIRLPSASQRYVEWRTGLSVLDQIGIVPLGFSKVSTDHKIDNSFSTMSTPHRHSTFGTPASMSRNGYSGSTAGGNMVDIDVSRIASKADNLRHNFSDNILLHLPNILLAAELLILVGWFDISASNGEDGSGFSKKSRQLLSFASSVTRWFKIPADVHKKLVAMDEYMMVQQ